MPVTTKLDNLPVRLPARKNWPAQDVFVNWRVIDSSNVERIGWDKFGNMYVQFKHGKMYVYFGVSRQRAVWVAHAASSGKALERVKAKFPAQVLTD